MQAPYAAGLLRCGVTCDIYTVLQFAPVLPHNGNVQSQSPTRLVWCAMGLISWRRHNRIVLIDDEIPGLIDVYSDIVWL